jgi:hypothetical protein
MVIVGTIQFKPETANDIGKRFLELAPVPDYLTLIGPFVKARIDGTYGLEIFEVDDAKLAHGLDYVSNRYISYYGIPDFNYTTEIFYSAQEALKMVGLA